jgi:hypothetical protein
MLGIGLKMRVHATLQVHAQTSMHVPGGHRHLSNIDCLMVRTACLACIICTVNGRSKKGKMPWNMWR